MIAVVGEALFDAHLDGGELRLFPGGGPFNTAVGLARLGVPVCYLGAVSRTSRYYIPARYSLATIALRANDYETASSELSARFLPARRRRDATLSSRRKPASVV